MSKGRLTQSVEKQFVESGEQQRIVDTLMKRLKESGWEDEVKKMVHKIIKEKGIGKDGATAEAIFEELKTPSRRLVSNETKQEVYQMIRKFVADQMNLDVDDI
ncbi:hypothetical protein WR25_24934 [Diploscapter pachys]|uniref:Transcription and mRNA export factor ENY2 n=1 Tax=Diploscapter pachys TaxID=2018661 RepID=A0A2A2J252_9BILA|nr:hypothetical protein WR25_24934 [Diploscapter pachys]